MERGEWRVESLELRCGVSAKRTHFYKRGNKNTPRGRGGVCPARDMTAARKLRVGNVGMGLDPSAPLAARSA